MLRLLVTPIMAGCRKVSGPVYYQLHANCVEAMPSNKSGAFADWWTTLIGEPAVVRLG